MMTLSGTGGEGGSWAVEIPEMLSCLLPRNESTEACILPGTKEIGVVCDVGDIP